MGKNGAPNLETLDFKTRSREASDSGSLSDKMSVTQSAPCEDISDDELGYFAFKLYLIKQELARFAKPA